jgi:uncharacterized protein (DUF302 family)
MFRLALVIAFLLALQPGSAHAFDPPPGWAVTATPHGYQTLIERLYQSIQDNKMGVVTRASATAGAKKLLGKTIPGNMVVGVYHPRFAVPMLEASIPAGIEAPLRIYITENADGSADLSYKLPSFVFAPYTDGGDELKALAAELDGVFAAIVEQASAP